MRWLLKAEVASSQHWGEAASPSFKADLQASVYTRDPIFRTERHILVCSFEARAKLQVSNAVFAQANRTAQRKARARLRLGVLTFQSLSSFGLARLKIRSRAAD